MSRGTRDMDLLDAVSVLVDRRISGAPVVDERGSLIGVLTEGDFLKAALVAGYHGESGGRVGDCMSREVQAVNADDSLLDVATAFAETNYRGFPVMEDNRVVGYITRRPGSPTMSTSSPPCPLRPLPAWRP